MLSVIAGIKGSSLRDWLHWTCFIPTNESIPAGMAPGSGQSYEDNGGQMVRPYGPCIHVDQTIGRKYLFFLLRTSSRMPLETGPLQLVSLRSSAGCVGLWGMDKSRGSLWAPCPEEETVELCHRPCIQSQKTWFQTSALATYSWKDLEQVTWVSLTRVSPLLRADNSTTT